MTSGPVSEEQAAPVAKTLRRAQRRLVPDWSLRVACGRGGDHSVTGRIDLERVIRHDLPLLGAGAGHGHQAGGVLPDIAVGEVSDEPEVAVDIRVHGDGASAEAGDEEQELGAEEVYGFEEGEDEEGDGDEEGDVEAEEFGEETGYGAVAWNECFQEVRGQLDETSSC